jgi:hypothetical protein
MHRGKGKPGEVPSSMVGGAVLGGRRETGSADELKRIYETQTA